MNSFELTPFLISLKLSFTTMTVLFFFTFPIAYYLAFSRCRLKPVLESIFLLPLILPPTVLGFYILLLLSPNHYPAKLLYDWFDVTLLFNFKGIVIASSIASFPFMFTPLKNGMEKIDKRLLEASSTLGKSKLETLIKIIIPDIGPYIISAPLTTFAHTMGAFGVILMVGGNIPGITKVASIAIYEKVEELKYGEANFYSLMLFLISITVLIIVNVLNKKDSRVKLI